MVSTSAAVACEFVIAPYSSGEVYAIRVQNGRPAWSDMLTRSHGVTALSEIDDIAGKPVVDRDLVFAISHSGVMAAIQLDKGDRQWQRDIGGIQTPWVAGDYIFVITLQNQLMCLTRKEGRVKWIHQLPRWVDPDDNTSAPIVWSGPVLVSDRLVVVSSDGYAQALSPYTGNLMARMEIPDAAYIAPVVANDTIYILTNNADLVALK
jgi:outer membrane protein assembly factor BamB